MSLFSIADLHLSLSVDKPMDKFGSRWTNHAQKLEKCWRAVVTDNDTVIVPGDISWAIDLEDALADFKFIDSLPGKKILGKGNHDYWWSTVTKMKAFFEENGITTIDFLYNNAHDTEDFIIAGTRGWYVEEKLQVTETADYAKIVARENSRLEMSLKEAVKLRGNSNKPILVYFHFPPVFKNFRCDEFIRTMKAYGIRNCYFGHIHSNYLIPRSTETDGIMMTIISADYLEFVPMITNPLDY
ncbi:MAG: serine/threonine protein phosphatase [Ruminococcaceae bacterium]|nr:serine/threonine protein phosphatase [Oscillospiraceae bacterium]